ncbi:MAG: Rieske 2Fe-2S domain-containing protein [Proteobacteria bacterium]|nr:Rieske 2Fe-2S domain-containing protein [Pseudomonadota bacterium]MCP4915566.1 Rieske 2Fe-2S domain-containing protein [Pseudomonadota bacterium]
MRASIRRAVGLGGAPKAAPGANAPRPEAAEKALNLGVEAPKDVNPPDGYEVVLHKDALKPGQAIEIIVAGKAIAVTNVDGTFYASTNTCPHAQGPLGEGKLDGHTLTCPYHGWAFDVRDGSCHTFEESSIETFAVEIVDNAVCVEV